MLLDSRADRLDETFEYGPGGSPRMRGDDSVAVVCPGRDIFITETSGLDAERYLEEMEERGFDFVTERTPDKSIEAQS